MLNDSEETLTEFRLFIDCCVLLTLVVGIAAGVWFGLDLALIKLVTIAKD